MCWKEKFPLCGPVISCIIDVKFYFLQKQVLPQEIIKKNKKSQHLLGVNFKVWVLSFFFNTHKPSFECFLGHVQPQTDKNSSQGGLCEQKGVCILAGSYAHGFKGCVQ